LRERETTGTGGDHTGLPCAMGYGLYALSSANQCSFATVASRTPLERTRRLTPASGRQDHATSPSVPTPHVWRHLHGHRIPLHVRDDAYAPLIGAERES